MNICALITGRGNNTLKNKNILPVLGKPLLTYPALEASKVKDINHFYVSSDCEDILEAASEYGFKKIRRPSELSKPDSKHIDALFHAVDYIEKKDNIKIDILVVLLANSATLKDEWISESIEKIKNDPEISAVVPVYNEQDHHPYRAKRINKDGSLDTFFDFTDMEVSTNRQELEPCYFLSHNFWVLNMKNSLYSENGQKPWIFLGNNVKPIIVEDCFDVHTTDDLIRSAKWLEENR